MILPWTSHWYSLRERRGRFRSPRPHPRGVSPFLCPGHPSPPSLENAPGQGSGRGVRERGARSYGRDLLSVRGGPATSPSAISPVYSARGWGVLISTAGLLEGRAPSPHGGGCGRAAGGLGSRPTAPGPGMARAQVRCPDAVRAASLASDLAGWLCGLPGGWLLCLELEDSSWLRLGGREGPVSQAGPNRSRHPSVSAAWSLGEAGALQSEGTAPVCSPN